MAIYVLDASAGLDLLLDTERGRVIESELEVGADWWVPEHYFMEVLSILRRYVRTGDLTQFEADRLVARLRSVDVSKAELQPMVTEVWALRNNLTPYDACYVVLARHLGAILVSTDFKLRGAPGLGVEFIPKTLSK